MADTRFLFFILLTITFIGCGPSREKQASGKLSEAQALRDSGRYNLARLKLDTLMEKYGDLTEQIADAMRLMDDINLQEQRRNLEYLDSMILVKEKELEPLMKNFIKSDEYGEPAILIHKRQKPENSYNRTFIRAHLDVEGDFYISSRYYGTSWIKHNQIKVYNSGESVTSEVVPEDGYNNRRFEDGGSKWEIISYRDGADNGIVNFIASNVDKPLKVQFRGEGYYYIVMEKYDKEAVRDGYETSFVLKELAGLRKERKQVERMVMKLEKRME
ncbi:outer membrane protein assembly factor BamD [Marinilabilia rubra]|uniref:Lipoprotein n=1 Tax=Marinilabilia rubra TaxID=2162893 RepID=A0A2U2B3A5_9BACT|nr:hypothetical protein [Marinilabilia rubra]PWD97545.1 hypothetical protein DDZ16_20230 [Marinilabilia rubra]